MAIFHTNLLIIALIVIITVLTAVMAWLNVQFYHEKKKYKAELESLQSIIAETSRKQSGQRHKIILSDEFDKKLKSDNAALGKEISGLNYELFELLSTNNLLNK